MPGVTCWSSLGATKRSSGERCGLHLVPEVALHVLEGALAVLPPLSVSCQPQVRDSASWPLELSCVALLDLCIQHPMSRISETVTACS